MDSIVVIENLYYRYQNSFIFDGFHMAIKRGSWTTIAGKNASGKSTFVRLMAGLLDCNESIKVDGVVVNETNIKRIRRMVGFVFENPDNQFVGESVSDNLAFALENLQYHPEDIRKEIEMVAAEFGITHLLDRRLDELSGGEKEKVAIASVLIMKPEILIIDEGLAMIDEWLRKEIFKILHKRNKEQGLTIINITHDLNDAYYSDYLFILEKGTIAIEGKTYEVLKHDRILNRLAIEMPFMVDLSNKLMFYGLLDDVIVDIDEMVGVLWK